VLPDWAMCENCKYFVDQGKGGYCKYWNIRIRRKSGVCPKWEYFAGD